jgi:WD40 repeat protein
VSCRLRTRLSRQRLEQIGNRPGPHEDAADRPDPRPGPLLEVSLREALAIVDEEIGRLPDKLRGPVVLCYLQGKTTEEAARELRCPVGTLRSRLVRARDLLGGRLRRRGVTPPVGALAALLATGATEAAVPADLARATAAGAVAFLGGGTGLPPAAVRLAREIVRGLTMNKMKLFAVALLMLGLLGVGAAVVVRQAASGAPPVETPPRAGGVKDDAPRAKTDDHGDSLPAGALARLGTVRWRHGPRVHVLAFAAGGREVVTAGPDGLVRVWDTATGRELRRVGDPADADGRPGGIGAVLATEEFFLRPTALAADGSRAATTAADGSIRVWDLGTGKELRRLKTEREEGLVAAALTPDGKGLLVATLGRVVLWDVATGKEVRHFEVKVPGRAGLDAGSAPVAVGAVIFSPDGKFLAAPFFEGPGPDDGLSHGVRLWAVTTGKEVRRVGQPTKGSNELPPTMPYPAFAPDGKVIAWAALDGTIRLHDTGTGKELRSLGEAGKGADIGGFAFAPDGKGLAVLRNDRTVRLYDVDMTGEIPGRFGKELRTLRETPPLPAVVPEAALAPPPLAFAADGKTLAVAPWQNTVRLWDTTTGKPLPWPAGHSGSVAELALARDGQTVLTHGTDNTLRRWQTATGKELGRVPLPEEGNPGALSPTGRRFAHLVDEQTVGIRDVDIKKEIPGRLAKDTATIKLAGGAAAPKGQDQVGLYGTAQPTPLLKFSPDERVLATGDLDGAVRLWDAGTGKALRTLAPDEDKEQRGVVLFGLEFAPDGKTLLTVLSRDTVVPLAGGGGPVAGPLPGVPPEAKSSLCLWDTATGMVLRRWEAAGLVPAAAFLPDGRSLATAAADGISLWEVATGKLRYHRKGPATLVTCAPDGRTLAVSAGPTVRLIDVHKDKELARLRGHQAEVEVLAFTGDGKRLVSGSADSTGLVWDVPRFTAGAGTEARELTAKQLDELWADLGGEDAGKAFLAATVLGESPAGAVALLSRRVQPTPEPDGKQVRRWVAELDHDQFVVRRTAAEELGRLGELARPALEEALQRGPSPEARKQMEGLLGGLKPGAAPAEDLRRLRAVEVLERIGTPEAKELLEGLAKGARGARLTREAEGSLQRLGR